MRDIDTSVKKINININNQQHPTVAQKKQPSIQKQANSDCPGYFARCGVLEKMLKAPELRMHTLYM
ncbi:predicted protein [Sclerotinia sclerotiorum 1980 UF-70]|uniref:Uncharacterized protein n=1 Tax=Sclerotinia sclerotiorum (strain ATCC 18683 / 1980 / Ss-1) TaxID=665079 RepID=A7EXW7_SCLS1|nr:predicted protein [Sclerotinia sclerotiorum 1980 UF-70]EDN94309.1 predicted protein [Sclerotinia sclerotiorum 1980 UF-70]